MAENVEGHRGRRGRWLVLAVVAAAVGAWVVRSWLAARAESDPAWPAEPVTNGQGSARTAEPQAVPAEQAPRRPSPRPRPAPTS
jgi:hypothetical protein